MEEQEHGVVAMLGDKLCVLRLNRPHKKNALRNKEYRFITSTLQAVAADDRVAIMVITGTGSYFTAGNDFVDAMQTVLSSEGPIDSEAIMQERTNIFQNFINALIDFPKPLVAVLNGPAVGVGVTALPLFDLVYASDKATFHTPFVRLGMVAEGCSSYTFPRLMGHSKAAEVLLFERKLTAEEACERGLVTEVFPDGQLSEVWSRLRQYAKLPPNTLVNIKNQMKLHHQGKLHKVNAEEVEALQQVLKSGEAFASLSSVFAKTSSKL